MNIQEGDVIRYTIDMCHGGRLEMGSRLASDDLFESMQHLIIDGIMEDTEEAIVHLLGLIKTEN